MTGKRTLTDADINALVVALRAPCRTSVLRPVVRPSPVECAIVSPQTPAELLRRTVLRINNSNVRKQNADRQELPPAMLAALLAIHARGGIKKSAAK